MLDCLDWRKAGIGAAVALATALTAMPALAAPQIVAAVPSNGPIALNCDADGCAAEISTICLQRGRAAPPPGARYAVHAPDRAAIAVTGVRADGGEMALDTGVLVFAALRGQVAFQVALPRTELARLGVAAVSVRIERPAMLVPAAVTGDAVPQTADDLARATDEIKATGGYWLARHGETMAVARVASRIINWLPAAGSIGREEAASLWSRAAAPEAEFARGGNRDSVARARHMVEFCRASAFEAGQFPMRRCLARFHDRVLQDLNRDYWNALKPQS